MISILINTLVQIAFLIVLADADADAEHLWTAWATAGSMAAACLGLCCMQVRYHRLAVDSGLAIERAGCWFDRAVGCC
jgi:hypothetical protein